MSVVSVFIVTYLGHERTIVQMADTPVIPFKHQDHKLAW